MQNSRAIIENGGNQKDVCQLTDTFLHKLTNTGDLSSLFKKEMQVDFSDYLTEKRITQAKFLLKNSNTSIVDIAGNLGFQSQSYFSNVFKKYTGKTPKQYRYSL